MTFANTESNTTYLTACQERGIKPHPARFPKAFPEFFIKLLTDEGDLVLDIFAGSNTTGYMAEKLARRWVAFEKQEEYLKGSLCRFRETEGLFSRVHDSEQTHNI